MPSRSVRSLILQLLNFLIELVPQLFVLLSLFDKLAGLIIQSIAITGKLACLRVKLIPLVLMILRTVMVSFLLSISSFNIYYQSSLKKARLVSGTMRKV